MMDAVIDGFVEVSKDTSLPLTVYMHLRLFLNNHALKPEHPR